MDQVLGTIPICDQIKQMKNKCYGKCTFKKAEPLSKTWSLNS